MSLRSAKRRRAARREKFAGCYVIHEPGARIGDVWLRPGAFTVEQVAKFYNASTEIGAATIVDGGLHVEITPKGYGILRESAERIGVEATLEKYGVELSDVLKALKEVAA
jgi:hypothetical protein